jgi:hypothetical protein
MMEFVSIPVASPPKVMLPIPMLDVLAMVSSSHRRLTASGP